MPTHCGKDWKGGGAVLERSGGMEALCAGTLESLVLGGAILEPAKEASRSKAARI
ncbi:hypothetical protein [uncultured Treponema sp.]|uniref:hypothetical protein n=1 Tax=uncultured Treponema sp. TaxID=162155 RepID=UPI0015C145B9|nr:hypothetical protein [uncultured Treponema sp.]